MTTPIVGNVFPGDLERLQNAAPGTKKPLEIWPVEFCAHGVPVVLEDRHQAALTLAIEAERAVAVEKLRLVVAEKDAEIERLRAEMAEETARLESFAGAMLEEWNEYFGDFDGGWVQGEMERAGLLISAEYDPTIHGDIEDCEPGDECMIFSELGKKCVATLAALNTVATQ